MKEDRLTLRCGWADTWDPGDGAAHQTEQRSDHKIQQHDHPVVDASNPTLKVEGITPELGVSIQHAVVASL